MGKSLGNLITLDQLFSGTKRRSGTSLFTHDCPLFYSASPLQKPYSDFSNEALKAAEKGSERLMSAVEVLDRLKPSDHNTVSVDELYVKCFEAMDDDLNTPILISQLFEGVRMINSIAAGKEQIDTEQLDKLKKLYHDFVFDILGLKTEGETVGKDHEVLGKVLDMVMSNTVLKPNRKKTGRLPTKYGMN